MSQFLSHNYQRSPNFHQIIIRDVPIFIKQLSEISQFLSNNYQRCPNFYLIIKCPNSYETIIRDVPPEILLRSLGTHAAQARLSATTRTALRCRSLKTINNKDNDKDNEDHKNKNNGDNKTCSQVI